MSKVFPHSDKKGMDAALNLVEDTLAVLRRRVQQQQHERGSGVRDAATNTSPPPPPPSITSSKGSKKLRSKSVLIKRKSKFKGKRTKQPHISSVQDSKVTQREEKVAEKVPQDYCKHCNPRSEGGRGKPSNTQRKRTSRPPSSDPKLLGVRERVVWKPAQRDHRGRKESEDSSQDCLCYGNTCRPLCDDPCPLDLREKVIWKHKARHKKEASQNIFQDCCLCHSDTCLLLRSARPLQDESFENLGVREESCGFGKRGHSKRDESDSSCRSNPPKTHRAARSSPKPRQTAQGNHTDTGSRSRERKMRDTDSQVQEHSKKDKKVHTHPKPAVDVDKQGYARPTHTSRQRTNQSRPRKEKENIIPYIPCGAKSHSYHIGITAQQEIGRLLNQPPRDHTHSHSKRSSGQQEGAAMTGLTQETVKQAMANIHHHLKGHTNQ
ncbi:uncharacterized protein LOC135091840 isoform X2 [Scylla paramamosain]|uniref:uncharacterized protein LOC135091840 isoform X2 n=1 Tax=Scylla paramamosain TaxID=85552 RepID=UPI0030838180